jgi:beta-D-xylosidase 4
MIGMWANGTSQMQGGYSGPAPYLHSPLYAAGQLGIDYMYANGPINQSTLTSNYSGPAMQAAKESDVILYFGGIDISVESEAMDRYQIAWPQAQLDLINMLSSLGKPVIVIQMGSMLDATPLLNNKNIKSLVWAGYPGQDGGPATFDVLTGAVAPAGRLPVTLYPADYVNQIPMTNMSLRPGPNNPGRTYKWYDQAVLPFGYGLHYTSFKASFSNGAMSNPHWGGKGSGSAGVREHGSYNIQSLLKGCTAKHPDLCAFPSVDVSVHNTGKTTSDFSAIVFSKTTSGPKPYPLKSTATYGRMYSIKPGQTTSASLNMTLGVIARRDEQGNQILYPGQYELLLDVPTQATLSFTLTGKAAVLDLWPQPPANQTYDATKDCPLYGPCGDQPVE